MAEPGPTSDIEAIATLREPSRRALYEYVARQPDPVSREQAADAVGVTRAVAGFHLDRLVEVGLLKADYRRLTGRTGPGAGRPAKLYRRSRRRFDESLPQRDHELLAEMLAAAAIQAGDHTFASERARAYGRSLGATARRRMRSPETAARRTQCVETLVDRLGFQPYRATEREIRLRNCPFEPLSRRFTPVVCGVGLALVGGIVEGVATDVLDVSRQERPDRCCIVLSSANTL